VTTQVYEAVFQNGAFRPVQPIPTAFAEGQHVRLVVEVEDNDVLNLATGVYEGLSDAEVREVEQIALDRRDFFGKAA
jgi:predicted DNA-binding antitoxin AbrB/MazE fold protein